MNKKVMKIASIALMTIMIISIAATALATTPGNLNGTEPSGTGINTVSNAIIGILRAVGVSLSVIVLIIIGIKYMMGSAEEKAEYKKTLMPYIVGAVLIFAASALAQVLYEFVTGIKLS